MRAYTITFILAVLATSFLIACDKSVTSVSEETKAGSPSSVRIMSGDQQYSLVGTVLPEPLVIKVIDDFGNAVPNADIEWSASGGSLESVSERTDSAGTAEATWTLPAEVGRYEVQIKAGAVAGSIQARATDFALACAPGNVEIPKGSSIAVLCNLEPLGCDAGEPSCDSSALMWLGFFDYPDTYLREDEQNTLRGNPFVTRVSVPEQIFKPEELQAEGVFMHPAGDNAKVFTSFDHRTTPFIPLSCMSSKHKVLQGRPSGEAWR